MYKLFLCLRYLRSRIIAYFAILGVALCVALLVISSSVMNGFLDKIEHAAKGLFGDIVIEAPGYQGIEQYDELLAAIRREVPEVEAGSPFILSVGFLTVPGQRHIRAYVQIAGIRLPERATVTDFARGLFVQGGLAAPTFDPDPNVILRRIVEETRKTQEIIRRESARAGKDGNLPPRVAELLDRLGTAAAFQRRGASNIRDAAENDRRLRELEAVPEKSPALEQQIVDLQAATWQESNQRVILGLGIPSLSVRTDKGETVRVWVPGLKVVLNIFPLGREMSLTDITPNTRRFSVVDDCRTDVSSIDSRIVYLDFDTLQVLNNMEKPYKRCSHIHLKVRPSIAGEARLRQVADKVADVCARFPRAHGGEKLDVRTWRQSQEEVIAPIESQRTLVTVMFGISALVCVVLIFVIFYMIVFQKTKEIGILKAVGGTGGGVAAIFLGYGAAVGLVGAAVGTVLGQLFVHHINPIHDWLARWLGFRVWDRKVFMFEKIPNTVDWTAAAFIVAGAILAGLIGALVPALRAARMQPVEALRYE